MAQRSNGSGKPIRDLTLWYSDLNFFDPEKKNELWLAQGIFYAKQNGQQFISPKDLKKYRDLDKGIIDKQEYINMIDPPTAMGGGGTAEYFAADFKTCPIDIHLDNQLMARLDKINAENRIQVSEIDKFAKTQKQKDKDRIIYQREFRRLINVINKDLGLPELKEGESPDAYIKTLQGNDDQQDLNSLVDHIKNQIRDDQDLSLYESFVYKGQIEQAFELGIQHYLINLNKWKIKAEYFNRDIKHHTRACGRLYTDETTGRCNVQYLNPDSLFTSVFREMDGSDIEFWFYEYPIPFYEFVKQFGANLNEEQLKEIFELNKNSGAQHGMSWGKHQSYRGSEALIMVGTYSVLTQDADKFKVTYQPNNVPVYEKQKLSWLPASKYTPNKYKSEVDGRIYNTWYSCYYIPPPSSRTARNTPADWAWQSKYIFNVHKDIDMYRYGVDLRYAKSTLVIWRDTTRMSYTDIKEAYMPKIRNMWHKFQNCLIQDTTAMAISQDFIGAVLNSVDEANKNNPADPDKPSGGNGMDASIASMRMLKQGGMAFLNFRDRNGKMIVDDPAKLFVPIDTKHLVKAEQYLQLILSLYNQMTLALAINDVSEGQDVKPRTPVEGITASLQSSREGMWFVEKPVREFLIMMAERTVQFLLYLVKEKKTYNISTRWDEFASVVGLANSWLMESVEEMQAEEIGITVSLEDVSQYQKYIIELANKMADEDKVSYDAVGLVINQAMVNWKYAYALLMLSAKQKERENAHKEELQFEREKEIQQMKVQQSLNEIKAKSEGKDQNIITQGKITEMVQTALAQLKGQTMTTQKDQLKNNRIDQDNNKARLQRENETHDELAPTGT